jgi:hypothetical protein
MAIDGMHHELLSHLKAKGAAPTVISEWESAWSRAARRPGSPLPCPECFLEGRVSTLDPRRRIGKLSEARCATCRIVFVFPEK